MNLNLILPKMIYFMYGNVGEIVKLNRDDINSASNSVIVHGKGDKEREVYFNTWCSLWLERYLDERDVQDLCLFIEEEYNDYNTIIIV
ncbi:hypothetical protein [Sutcliffiella horikoshii]|uniref:hypothetical protein n=1 Tax=Sutcliffiella horikoshii TaxID=79883 RepID=UPI00384FCBE3